MVSGLAMWGLIDTNTNNRYRRYIAHIMDLALQFQHKWTYPHIVTYLRGKNNTTGFYG